MTLETMIAYTAVLGLPLWLVVEEVLHRFAAGAKALVAVPVAPEAEGRAPEGAQAA
jgi:hypothetical protein